MRPIFIGVVVVSGSLNATMLSMVVGSFFGLKKLQCGRYWAIFARDPANKNPTELFSCLVGCSMLQQVVFHFLALFGELGSLSSPKLKRLWKTAYLLCISYKLVAQMPKWKSWWLDSSKFLCPSAFCGVLPKALGGRDIFCAPLSIAQAYQACLELATVPMELDK